MAGKFNDLTFNLVLKQGTAANLALATTYLQQGEPAYTTDDKQLWIVDAANVKHLIAQAWNATTQTSAYAAVAWDIVLCNTTSAGFTVTIPSAASNKGKSIRIKKTSSDSNAVTVSAADSIDGSTSWTIDLQYVNMEIFSDGTTWWIV